MPYDIQCTNRDCGRVTNADDIVKLIDGGHLDAKGWIRCKACNGRGFINRWFDGPRFFSRESDSSFGIFLKAVVKLPRVGNKERNFAFLASLQADEPPEYVWPCCYYEDDKGMWRVCSGPFLRAADVVGLASMLGESGFDILQQ